jgi:hypothetical protein
MGKVIHRKIRGSKKWMIKCFVIMSKRNFLKTILFVFSFLFIFNSLILHVWASPSITSFLLNGKSENVTINPENGEKVKISLATNNPVKFNMIAICSVSVPDKVCNTTTAVKYFKQINDYYNILPYDSSKPKEWDGKTGGNNPTPVDSGEYKVKITMGDESGATNYEIGKHSIFIDYTNNTSQDENNNDENSSSTNISISTSSASVIIKNVYVSSHSDPEDLSDYDKEKIFEVAAGRERMALVGSSLEFNAKYTLKNIESCTPSFSWSFGDGYSYSGKKVSHIYGNQGEYNVILNATCGDESAVSRTKTKIYNPEIEIISVENGNIEIKNKSNVEINIGGWSIKNYQKNIILSKDTIVSSKHSIILSDNYLKLGSVLQYVSLIDESKKEISSVFINLPDSPVILSSDNLGQGEQVNTMADQAPEVVAISHTSDKEIILAEKIEAEDIKDTNFATVYEPETSTHTPPVISRIVSFPINVIKSFLNLFYDF